MPGDIPPPSEHRSWPSWFYPPDTDPENPAVHGRVFEHADDVPEGWAADWHAHGENLNREPPSPPPPPEIDLTRAELRAELTKRGIAFSPTAAKVALQVSLAVALEAEREAAAVAEVTEHQALRAELIKRDIPFDTDADQAVLQELLDDALEAERLEEST